MKLCVKIKNGCLCNGHNMVSSHELEGCPVCGSKLTNIRGKHPGEPERLVCATCLQERMDTILEMANSDFHIAGVLDENGLDGNGLLDEKV